MKLNQLSIFLENRPGQLGVPCRTLAKAGINILAMTLADTQQFGILHLIVQDWQKAAKALEKAKCVVKTTQVVPIAVPHQPGGLAKVLETIEKAGINVEYMYAFPAQREEDAVIIFRFEDADAAVKALGNTDIRMLKGEQVLAELAGKAL